MQSRRKSFIEACVNTFIGFLITLFFAPLIYKMSGMQVNAVQMSYATFYFTILSVIRSYLIRRFFNKPKL